MLGIELKRIFVTEQGKSKDYPGLNKLDVSQYNRSFALSAQQVSNIKENAKAPVQYDAVTKASKT